MLELNRIHCGDNCDLLGQLPRETLREALTEAYMMGAQNVLGRM